MKNFCLLCRHILGLAGEYRSACQCFRDRFWDSYELWRAGISFLVLWPQAYERLAVYLIWVSKALNLGYSQKFMNTNLQVDVGDSNMATDWPENWDHTMCSWHWTLFKCMVLSDLDKDAIYIYGDDICW